MEFTISKATGDDAQEVAAMVKELLIKIMIAIGNQIFPLIFPGRRLGLRTLLPRKIKILLCLLFAIMWPSLVLAQAARTTSPVSPPAQNHPHAKKADIVSFHVETKGEGALHILYSNGTEVEIPKERGRFADGEHTLTQKTFSDIQLADDRQYIGWFADYMICQQSYPCTAELVIYQSGHKPKYISPPVGIMWKWWFRDGGKQVVAQFGFPHGDETGAYALYDTKTGRKLAFFSPKEEKKAPRWLQPLPSLNK
jgi:hypothetical protein